MSGRTGVFFSRKSTFNGNEREDWDVDRPRAAKSPQPLDPASRMEMDVLFGDAFKKAQTLVNVPSSRKEDTTPDVDDTPF